MTAFVNKGFQGEFPRTQPQDLPPSAAQSATDCDFTQNILQGIRSRSVITGISVTNPKTIYISESVAYSVYAWDRDVDAVRSPVTDDAYNRFYWSDGTSFYVSRSDLGTGGEPATSNRFKVGVPAPTAALAFVSVGTATSYAETRAYTYTYVNQYGEEGPPAAPFTRDMTENQPITLSYTAPPSGHGYAPITKVRVYRTATGGQGTDYLFVAELAIWGSTQFTDSMKNSELGEALSTRNYYPPPQNLKGICALPNGSLVGFSTNVVWFSEPYLPYAWKPANTQTVQHNIVSICPYENGLYVTTQAHPVAISGYAPDGMSAQKISAVQAGVSKGSMVNAGAFVAYASNDGIVTIRGMQASLDLSFQFFTRDEWRTRYGSKLSQLRLNVHDGHLLGWFTDGTPGFLIRMDETTPSFTKMTDPITCAFVHPEADALYVCNGSSLYSFKTGVSRKAYTHWSKDFMLEKPESLGAIQLIGGGSVGLTVYADGNQVFQTSTSVSNTGSTVLRLPSGFRARRWSFKIDGQADSFVQQYSIVTSPSELANV